MSRTFKRSADQDDWDQMLEMATARRSARRLMELAFGDPAGWETQQSPSSTSTGVTGRSSFARLPV